MAKKIDAKNQGQTYLNSLLKDRPIVPLGEEEVSPVVNSGKETPLTAETREITMVEEKKDIPAYEDRQSYTENSRREEYREPDYYPSSQRPEYRGYKKLGRRRQREKVKTRFCFSVDPDALENLKKVAYIRHEVISNILEDYVMRYVELHKEDVEQFEALPQSVKDRARI